ncbi:TadE/TadG family type IV pilus assembly protein [Novosphingobium sp.]|uniref:TadE/TadG family type IV pilus assembly protein n=1 Tax=Novosphingobium sp. TaxID=1874826 RepID=UPI002736E0D3|nr:TadE/TadG family type IV pilus assembly protein [Novosphingobium sp.]MDP3907502.1 TadE/TadG family type IV pilus assembly protein [Novosphingobium sp.]
MTRRAIIAQLSRLKSDDTGATIVEFALVSPVLMLLLMGLFDLAYNMYTNEMLNGAVQQAARNATVEGAAGRQQEIDAGVTRAIRAVAPGATMTFNRRFYAGFSDVNRPEDWDDIDGNGTCDNGELFEDANGNGIWDANAGADGIGGARDAVLYSVTIDYPRMFPVYSFLPGQSNTFSLTANTVLRNQPFGAQQVSQNPTTGNCTA